MKPPASPQRMKQFGRERALESAATGLMNAHVSPRVREVDRSYAEACSCELPPSSTSTLQNGAKPIQPQVQFCVSWPRSIWFLTTGSISWIVRHSRAASARRALALLYEQTAQRAEAAREWRTIHEIDPANREAKDMLERLAPGPPPSSKPAD